MEEKIKCYICTSPGRRRRRNFRNDEL